MNKLESQISLTNIIKRNVAIQEALGNKTYSDYVPLIMTEDDLNHVFGVTFKDVISKTFRKITFDGLDVGNGATDRAKYRFRKIATPNFDRDKSNEDLVWFGFEHNTCDTKWDRPRFNFFVINQENESVKNAVCICGETAKKINDGTPKNVNNFSTEIFEVKNSEVEKTSKRKTKAKKSVKKSVKESVVPKNDTKLAVKKDDVKNVVVERPVKQVPVIDDNYELPVIKNKDGFLFDDVAPEVADCILHGEHVYIYGPAGCGKSTMARMICRELGKEPYEVDFSSGIDEATFIGTQVATTDDNGNPVTKFQYGLFPKAVMEGRPIIVNEADMGQPQYLAALHGILEENDSKLVILDNGAEVLYPKEGFCVIATGNSAGGGDDNGDYSGVNMLNKAFLDRFSAFFEMGYSKKESQIVKKLLINSKKHLTQPIMHLVKDIRKLKEQETVDSLFSTRKLIMLAGKVNRWGVKRAIELVILARLDKDERQVWNEVVQRHFPKDFDETVIPTDYNDNDQDNDQSQINTSQTPQNFPF